MITLSSVKNVYDLALIFFWNSIIIYTDFGIEYDNIIIQLYHKFCLWIYPIDLKTLVCKTVHIWFQWQ